MVIISDKFLVNELTDFYEAASYCPHNDKAHKSISWLTQYICCAGIFFPGDLEHSFTKPKYSGKNNKKKFTAQYLYLWLLSKIIREMPVGTVVIVNVKHCAVLLLLFFFFFHVID